MTYEVGKYYEILCVTSKYKQTGRSDTVEIPVLGEEHDDKELGQDNKHYHIDLRFITENELKLMKSLNSVRIANDYSENLFDYPFIVFYTREHLEYKVQTLVKKCLREIVPKFTFEALEQKYVDKKLNSNCMKCPHKGTDLNNAPIDGEFIRCPSHGLKFNRTTLECQK